MARFPAKILSLSSPPTFTGGNWTSSFMDVSMFSRVWCVLFMNQPSTANGFSLQASNDGTNVHYSVSTTANANDGVMIVLDPRSYQYIRVSISVSTVPTILHLAVFGE